MLKLKYLFNDVNLAEMLLKNWEFEKESIDMFKYYRISSNAIYPFKCDGKTQFLRFAPKEEKSKENILAELDFISYLRANHYGALESVTSKNGEELVEAHTPWGDFYASVFKRVPGVQMNKTDFSDSTIFSHGKALGKLHQLSSEYTPIKTKRWSYSDVLDWIQDHLMDYPEETAALKEATILKEYFLSLPVTNNNFGLIHYDFEYDNVFFDEETKSCHVIDFDDAMYHWYAMDIEKALDSLRDYIPAEDFSHKSKCFMDGYLTEYDVAHDISSFLPACRRFANLYAYVRILRSITEKWNNEPEWLINLRGKLSRGLQEKSACFGEEI
ncbi:phosphotransferase enzyme family protein [Paenibacillus radicis (ex Xue et al. 2023)]|uniref:Phosphotransferase n=1 Tax=Paenibacillus radicis (ex Xue et al. 2023) TaxID=2972489 RepID=A0ABT1YQC6_9BACL|nr:phosphotransferase [Paenibacillus radicis (ex Xue et al. 2023)]MCR8634559.1 phosphotransferase [Paenibacillus radicis (ex Xue et al. 2023)]